MARAGPIRNVFSRGEISPLLYGRYDLPVYQAGAKTIQNMIVLPQGGVQTIPGSLHVTTGAVDADAVRLHPLIANSTTSYAIEFGDLTIRAFKNDGTLAAGPVVSPYAIADVFELQFVQIGAALYIFHEDYDPRTLTWSSPDSFAFATPVWTGQTFTGAGERPRACALHQGRLLVAKDKNSSGTSILTVYGSKPFSYTDFTVGDLDDDGLEYEVAGQESTTSIWMAKLDRFVTIGTEGNEVVLTGGQFPLTPSAARAEDQSDFGSARVQGLRYNDVVAFVDRSGKQVVEYQPGAGNQAYRSIKLTDHADHIAGASITQLAIQKHPHRLLWAVSSDGHVAVLSYKREANTVGWSKFVPAPTTAGASVVESIAIIPGAGAEDMVWMSVKRTIDGGTRRYIEYLKDYDWGASDRDAFQVHSGVIQDLGAAVSISGGTAANPVVVAAAAHGFSDGDQVAIAGCLAMPDINNLVFSVSNPTANTFELRNEYDTADIDGSAYSRDATLAWGTVEKVAKTITGLSHLEGEECAVRYDGGTHSKETVSGGQITLDEWANTVHVGLPRTWTLSPTSIVNAVDAIRTKIRVFHLLVRLYKTLGVKAGTTAANAAEVIFTTGERIFGQAPPLFSGTKELEIDGSYDNEGDVVMTHDEPQPVTILSAQPVVEANRR